MNIGVTGPTGAGKDTAADYLAEVLGGIHVSGGDVLRDMLTSLGLEPKKSALGDFGTFLRNHYGANVITDMVERRADGAEYAIFSGFRSPLEAAERKRKGGVILYIDASDDIRHKRVYERGRDGGIASEELQRLDQQELASTETMAENLAAVKEHADAIIINEGSIEDLRRQLDRFVAKYVH